MAGLTLIFILLFAQINSIPSLISANSYFQFSEYSSSGHKNHFFTFYHFLVIQKETMFK